MISAKIRASSGAISDGLSTTVQPAASAGATLAAIWFNGQFHGVISAATPMASRRMQLLPRVVSNSKSRSACSVACSCARPIAACRLVASVIGAPISWRTACARSPVRAW
ncbi:hypothetical protein D9M72_352280 [compost metagenome]